MYQKPRPMNSAKFFALIAAAILAFVLGPSGCGGPNDKSQPADSKAGTPTADSSQIDAADASEKPHFAFVVNNSGTFWKIANAGVKKAAAEFGVVAEMRTPPRGSIDEQQAIIEQLIAKGVDGMAISPIDPENMVRVLNEAADHMILITHDSDAPLSNRQAYIGTNNIEAGRLAGEMIKKALPDGGEIVIFVGRLDALVGLWAYNGPAIVSAVKDAGLTGKIKIIAFDEEAATLQGIQDGFIEATIVQKPFEFGYQSIRLLNEIYHGDRSRIPADKLIDTGVEAITQDKVVPYWENLKKLTQ